MYSIKNILPILSIILSGCVIIPTYKTHVSLIETNSAEQGIQIDDVLLVGSGPVASRVFLENLSSVMAEDFKAKGVHAEFTYIGKLQQSTSYKLDSLVSDAYDSYLIFKASDSSYLDMTKEKSMLIGPGISGTHYGNQYAEKYKLLLYKKRERMRLVWQGRLNVDFDLANNSRYKRISDLILKELGKTVTLVK